MTASLHDEIRDLARQILAGKPGAGLDGELAAAGLLGLEIPEAYGGGGGSFPELAVVLEVLGEHAATSALPSTVLAAAALALAGSEPQRARWLPRLADGTLRATVALTPYLTPTPTPTGGGERAAEDGYAASSDQACGQGSVGRVIGVRGESGWRLSGRVADVLDARAAGLLVIPARTAEGWLVALVEAGTPGLAVTARPLTDETRCLDDLALDELAVADADVLAIGGEAARLLGALVNRAAVAVTADSVGVARRVLDMTVEYVRRRHQFGRSIGSFQAVKHKAADMFVDLETASALVEEAVRLVALDPFTCDVAVSLAKDHACELAARDAGVALQLHGGIGYTWEYDLHRYFKRALLNEHLVGAPAWHRTRTLQGLPLPPV